MTTVVNEKKWDYRWLEMAKLVSSHSKDPSTQTGAVIIRPDNSVAAVGYNGFPRKMEDREEWLNSREEKYSRMVHCEVNAVLSLREQPKGYTLYTWPFLSCDRCAVQMIQAGIARIVAPMATEEQLERWRASFERTLEYCAECDVDVSLYAIV